MSVGTCSRYGHYSHGASTWTEGGGGAAAEGTGGSHSGIMLFGVRLNTEGSFRKSASMNSLSQYEHVAGEMTPDNPGAVDAGYASDDVVHQSGRGRERKRGTPWTEEEHRMFLNGLQKVGKGDWRGISRNFVKTRTPTQVASHAQKYFLRRSNKNRRRRRSSLFDITTESQLDGPSTTTDESNIHQEITMPEKGKTPKESRWLTKPKRPIPVFPIPPPSSKMASLDLNWADSSADATIDPLPLSLKLPMQGEKPTSPRSASVKAMPNGDSIITVA